MSPEEIDEIEAYANTTWELVDRMAKDQVVDYDPEAYANNAVWHHLNARCDPDGIEEHMIEWSRVRRSQRWQRAAEFVVFLGALACFAIGMALLIWWASR